MKSKTNIGIILAFLTFLLIVFLSAFAATGYYVYSQRDASDDQEDTSSTDGTNVTDMAKNISSSDVYEADGRIVDLVDTVSPAVTTVVIQTSAFNFETFSVEEQSQGTGTGFFVNDSGLLITNQHVVCGITDASSINVITSDGEVYGVKTFDTDPFQDLAILEVDMKGEKSSFVQFANPNSVLKVGQDVIAVGNPFGDNPNSVTRGIISGLNRNIEAAGNCGNSGTEVKQYEGVLQTDAAINFGNSGGPLLNLDGEVIGVNAATNSGANNVSYAIPFDRVVSLIERYDENNGNIIFPFLGVEAMMIGASRASALDIPQGAIVAGVQPGSAADSAGLQRYDIITKVDENKIDFSLSATLNQYFDPGQEVKLEVYRRASSDIDIFGEGQGVQNRLVYLEEPIIIETTLGERDL